MLREVIVFSLSRCVQLKTLSLKYGIDFKESCQKTRKTFGFYFSEYGGFQSLIVSPYFVISIVLTVSCSSFVAQAMDGTRSGVGIIFSVIPNILGFSMGGMAIVASLSTHGRFIKISEGKEYSLFSMMMANFFHFVLIQCLAIIFCVLSSAYLNFGIFAYIALFLFFYSILSAVAIAGQLLNVSSVLKVISLAEESAPVKPTDGQQDGE